MSSFVNNGPVRFEIYINNRRFMTPLCRNIVTPVSLVDEEVKLSFSFGLKLFALTSTFVPAHKKLNILSLH